MCTPILFYRMSLTPYHYAYLVTVITFHFCTSESIDDFVVTLICYVFAPIWVIFLSLSVLDDLRFYHCIILSPFVLWILDSANSGLDVLISYLILWALILLIYQTFAIVRFILLFTKRLFL